MATNLSICKMSDEVKQLLAKFRFRKEKNTAAISMKINKATLEIVLDEEFEDISIADLQEELSDTQPRYVALSYVYKHDDGRLSYPLMFIFISPPACNPEQQMMYASSKQTAVQEGKFTKVIELRNLEDLTEETVLNALKKY